LRELHVFGGESCSPFYDFLASLHSAARLSCVTHDSSAVHEQTAREGYWFPGTLYPSILAALVPSDIRLHAWQMPKCRIILRAGAQPAPLSRNDQCGCRLCD